MEKIYIMALFDKILNLRGRRIIVDRSEFYDDIVRLSRSLASGDEVLRFSQATAYLIANTLAEVNFPIDYIADKVSTLKFSVETDAGKIVERLPKPVERLLKQPNVLSSFSQMIYDAVFILLSDGTLVGARNKPSLLSDFEFSPENIQSINLLYPGSYAIRRKYDASPFFASSKSDLFTSVDYTYGNHQISYTPDAVDILGIKGVSDCDLRYPSPLIAAERNINNLLVVYQARYRAYTKNGMGMIISPKPSNGASSLAATVNNSFSRDKIVADILQRYGISGDNPQGREKLLWAVSGAPVDAVKTLATISELQPFEETREDALAIAGVFNVDKDLLPSKDGTTFTNKEAAEAGIYTGIVTTMANDVFEFLSKLMCLDKIGIRLVPNTTDIPVLQKQRLNRAEADNKVIDLLVRMRENGLASDQEIKNISEKIINNYML